MSTPPPVISPAVPQYEQLVRFLVGPYLEAPDSLKVDCEPPNQQGRVWIRVAFEGDENGRFFGRGGRNLQSIRTVLAAAAACVGQTPYLDIYNAERDSGRTHHPQRRRRPSAVGADTTSSPPRRSRPADVPSAPSPYSF